MKEGMDNIQTFFGLVIIGLTNTGTSTH